MCRRESRNGAGWRHATGQEVCELFKNYALPPIEPCPSAVIAQEPGDSVTTLQGFLGDNGEPGVSRSAGIFDDQNGDPGRAGLADVALQSLSSNSYAFPDNANLFASWDNVGHFLVRGFCGNGTPDPPEECDDGNQLGGDGCSANCLIESAGIPAAPALGLALFAALLLGTGFWTMRRGLPHRA